MKNNLGCTLKISLAQLAENLPRRMVKMWLAEDAQKQIAPAALGCCSERCRWFNSLTLPEEKKKIFPHFPPSSYMPTVVLAFHSFGTQYDLLIAIKLNSLICQKLTQRKSWLSFCPISYFRWLTEGSEENQSMQKTQILATVRAGNEWEVVKVSPHLETLRQCNSWGS